MATSWLAMSVALTRSPHPLRVLSASLRKELAAEGTGRSVQPAEEEFNASFDASLNLACPAGVGMRCPHDWHSWRATRWTWISLPVSEAGPVSRTGYVVMRRTSAVPAQLVQVGFLALAVVRPIAVHLLAKILPERVADVKPWDARRASGAPYTGPTLDRNARATTTATAAG
jgi:hypothetical protein